MGFHDGSSLQIAFLSFSGICGRCEGWLGLSPRARNSGSGARGGNMPPKGRVWASKAPIRCAQCGAYLRDPDVEAPPHCAHALEFLPLHERHHPSAASYV
jgi:hypothetical protein